MIRAIAFRRHVTISVIIAGGAAVFAALWLLESLVGIISPTDRVAYPIVISFLLLNLLIMALVPRFRPTAELASFAGAALYLLLQMVLFASGSADQNIYNIANGLQWMPVLYVTAFMFFSRRRAILAGGGTFAVSGMIFLWLVLVSPADLAGPRVPALLLNAIAAHLLVLLSLSLVITMRLEFERISTHARSMEDAALTDPLTGISNRRGLEARIRAMEDAPHRGDGALILLDIDHFKSVNDSHGHLVGDEVLVSTAQLIRSQLRSRDIVGRWGGEEFLVVIEDGSLARAAALANRVRQIVSASVHPVAGSVTISAGVAIWSRTMTAAEAFAAADGALYAAKAGGRDRVAEA